MRTSLLALSAAVPLAFAASGTIRLQFDPDLTIDPVVLLRSVRVRFGLSLPLGLRLGLNLRERDAAPARRRKRGLLGGVLGGVGSVVGGVTDTVGSVVDGVSVGVSVGVGGGGPTQSWGSSQLGASNDNQDVAWSAMIGFGTPAQQIRCIVDSGSASPVVYAPNCTSCALNNHTAFDGTKSSTFSRAGSARWSQTFNDGSTVAGQTAQDVLALGSLSAGRHLIGLTDRQTGFPAATESSCILGFGRDAARAFGGSSTLTPFSALVKAGVLDAPLVGSALVDTNKVTGTSAGGSFSIGAIESRYVLGSIVYAPVLSSNFWGTTIDGMSVRGGRSVLAPDDSRRAIYDTATSLILVSDATAKLVHAQIPGAEYFPETETWGVPCDAATLGLTAPAVFWHIGGSTFGIPPADLAFQGSILQPGVCVSAIQGGSPSFTVLGAVFLASASKSLERD